MLGVYRKWCGLCLPPLILVLLDAVLTLYGQPPRYWQGDYRYVHELSPIFRQLLHIGPGAFLAGTLVWIIAFNALIMLLPDTLALAVSLALVLGHAWGASSWLFLLFPYGYSYSACVGLFVITAVIASVSLRWGWGMIPPASDLSANWLSPPVRWLLAAALLVLACYLFLGPHGH